MFFESFVPKVAGVFVAWVFFVAFYFALAPALAGGHSGFTAALGP